MEAFNKFQKSTDEITNNDIPHLPLFRIDFDWIDMKGW